MFFWIALCGIPLLLYLLSFVFLQYQSSLVAISVHLFYSRDSQWLGFGVCQSFFPLVVLSWNMDVWLPDVWINCCAVVVFQASQDCCLCGKGDPPIPLAQYGNILLLVPMDLEVTLARFENKTFESRRWLLAKKHRKKQWVSCFFPEKQSRSSTNDLSAHLGRWLLQPWSLDLHHPVCHSSTSQLWQQFPVLGIRILAELPTVPRILHQLEGWMLHSHEPDAFVKDVWND